MISRIHQKLGTAGFIISIVALVAALGGGAYAASGGLSGKQKKEVEKIAKKVAGKPGAPGANGANGAPGAKGDTGAAGAEGKQGPEGEQGEPGEEGEQGIEGSPWTAGGTLPEEQTETGTWSFIGGSGTQAYPTVASFPIPLSAPLPGGYGAAHLVGFNSNVALGFKSELGKPEDCKGTVDEPTAPPGALCIYLNGESELGGATIQGIFTPGGSGGVGTPGAVFWITQISAGSFGFGSWAVTAG